MAKTLQDILKRRQQEEFVGREEQLVFFQENLGYAPEDPRRRFVISVSGQGGVGKTWLLRHFRKIAEEAGAVTAYTDETENDIPGVMGRIAEQFKTQAHSLKTFAERYKVYRQRRQEIEADPDAPQGFPAFLGRTLAKGGLRLARRVPVGGVVADFVDEEAFASLAGDFSTYVARKIHNKDEVRLVLEPVEVLTPLFLADLRRIAEKHSIVLFFDTYERTVDFLDPWLRNLLEGRYGDVPADIILVIAGRELNHNLWALYEGLLVRLPLEPFTDEEARGYLVHKGITDERVVEAILDLSGRLPLLVATLAAESPDDPTEVGDPGGEAVERFLKWVEDSDRRQLALDAALPRRLDRDVLSMLVEEEKEIGTLFAWLMGMPFVERRGDGWIYNDVVRMQMLRYKRREALKSWANLHSKMVEYYEGLRSSLGLSEEEGRKHRTWQAYALEVLYHQLCWAPQTHQTAALAGFLAALETQRSFAQHWAEVISNAGMDTDVLSMKKWGQCLVDGLKNYDEALDREPVDMFTTLLNQADLETRWRAVALVHRGEIYELLERYEEALADFDRAIKLNPDYAKAIAHRGTTYRLIGRYEDALANFNRAIQLDPDDAGAVARRGEIYELLERYEEALADFDRAIELDPSDAGVVAHRGTTYRLMERYEEALADFDRAIELDPDDAGTIAGRGATYLQMERYEDALADFDRAIELTPDDTWIVAIRGTTYRLMQRYEEALADFNRAVRLDPYYAWAIASRGTIYELMEQYEEALTDFDRAIELHPHYAWAIACRGATYRLIARYEEALADFDRAIELTPDYAWAIAGRGETYRLMERYNEAIEDFERAIELDPDYVWVIAGRGAIYLQMKRYEEALADFNRAVQLDPDEDWYLYNRAITYRVLGQTVEVDNDLTLTIRLARQTYEKCPQRWQNTLNLALYHLAAEVIEKAEHYYREALSGHGSRYYIHEATRKLEDFLVLFPNHPQAQAMHSLLQKRPFYTEAHSFLTRAGFAVQSVNPFSLLCVSDRPLWTDVSPLYVQLMLEQALDLDAFQDLCREAEVAYGEDLRGHTAAVVINRPPRAGDLYQIFALRAQRGFTVVPLPRSLLIQAQRNRREVEALQEQVELYTGRANLYDVRSAVTDILSFFGRGGLLADLERRLTAGQSVIIFGTRKVGKSSLLGRLREECAWPIALVDLEGYVGGLGYVYREALHSWQAALQTTFPRFSLSEWMGRVFTRDPTAQAQIFRQAVGDLLNFLADRPGRPGLLLFLDEIDTLFGQPGCLEFAAVLRSVAEDPRYRGRLALMAAGLEPTLNKVDRIDDGRNPFYSFFSEVSLGPLDLEDARTMVISIGGQMQIGYTDEALDLLVETCGGHPFLTRQLCSQAIQNLNRPGVVDAARAAQAVEDYIHLPHNYLAESLWGIDSDGPPPAEATLLQSLATAQPQIAESLIPPALPPEDRRARHLALGHLHDQSLVRRAGNGWELTIPLYRHWIRRYILNLPDRATTEDSR